MILILLLVIITEMFFFIGVSSVATYTIYVPWSLFAMLLYAYYIVYLMTHDIWCPLTAVSR